MLRYCLAISLILFPFLIIGQTEIDSLKKELSTSKHDSVQIDLLGKLAYKTLKGYVAQSGIYAKQAMALSEKYGDPRRIAQSYIHLGNYYARSGTIAKHKVDSLYLEALQLATELEDSTLMGIIYNDLGIQASAEGDRVKAIEWYQLSLKSDLDTSNPTQYSMTLRNIGIIHDHNERFDLAERYFKDAIAVAEKGNDLFEQAESTNSLGITTSKKGDLRGGLNMFKKAATMYATQNRPETLLNTLNNIIFSYQVMGHLDSAGIYMENVLDQAMESGNHQLQMRVMITMANHLESQGKLDASLSYLQKAMILAPRNADPYHEQGILQNLSRIYKKKGDLKNALTYSERFHAFKDSMVNAESLARISDLELLYESSIKDQQLERQGLQLAKQKDERVLFLVIIGLLLAGTIGIILGLRERMNSRSKLAKQQQLIQDQKIAGLQNENRMISMSSMIKGQEEERSRIAQDLHDGLGGLMATIKSHYATVIDQEGNEELNSKTASLIEQACSEVSRISHNLMPNALAEYGLTEAVTDLAVSLKDGHGMNVEVDFRGMESRLSETEETMIYRIIQELTTNIAKHAKAKSVLIQMLRKNGEALILVEDDGRGFNLEKARSNGGLGIKGLESRVKYLNGNIEFDTVEGEGTTVAINVKLNTAHQNEQFKE